MATRKVIILHPSTNSSSSIPLNPFAPCRPSDLGTRSHRSIHLRGFQSSTEGVRLADKRSTGIFRAGFLSRLNPLKSRTPSSKTVPSFVPSNRTLEFRIIKDSTLPHSPRFRWGPGDSQPSNLSPTIPDVPENQPQDAYIPNPMTPSDTSRVDRELTEKNSRISTWREENWTIRCTHIDQHGRIRSSRSMSKSEICAQNRLQPRDLRKIDSRIANVVPSILVRDQAIIFNVLNIRALIKADSVILFDHPSTPSVSAIRSDPDQPGNPKFTIRSAFLHNLIKNLRDRSSSSSDHNLPGPSDLPYEFRAMEIMLSSVAATLESELGVLRTLVSSLLEGLERNIEREKLKQLLLYSRRISAFNSRALLVQECLDEFLDSDEDMDKSYLGHKILKDAPNKPHDHEELEQLLESFSKYLEEIVHEGKSILTNIKSTEEIIELILDSNRNTLLALDLKVSIATMGLGTGALIAGLFGMNLRTNMEHHPYAFLTVTTISLGTVSCAIAYGWMKLYRLRRIGLSAAGHVSSPNPSWRRSGHLRGGLLDWDVPSKVCGSGKWKELSGRTM